MELYFFWAVEELLYLVGVFVIGHLPGCGKGGGGLIFIADWIGLSYFLLHMLLKILLRSWLLEISLFCIFSAF